MKNMNIENHDGHIWKQVEYLTFKHHRAEKKNYGHPIIGNPGDSHLLPWNYDACFGYKYGETCCFSYGL